MINRNKKNSGSPEINNIKEILSNSKIVPVNVTDQMSRCFISYAMAVNVSRAIPDVRDGLKPVHRRILYAMQDLGNTYDKPTKKCARIVGEVMGKYHPHGDSSVYDALVRLAQWFSINVPLVDGQGNFGTVDGDPAAAQRYTEARLSKIAGEMLRDIDKDTVDFYPNFDDTLMQPVVLPARFPNLLVNGSEGIAVGMATSIPPHNLGEVIGGTIALLENPEITVDELMNYIPAPDYPTGGIIMGKSGDTASVQNGTRRRRYACESRNRRSKRQRKNNSNRTSLSGKQSEPYKIHSRSGEGQKNRRHIRHSRRKRPFRYAYGNRNKERSERERRS